MEVYAELLCLAEHYQMTRIYMVLFIQQATFFFTFISESHKNAYY